jgi:radical SAM protein with 4Fe4S-binding SPASM domain
MGDSKASSPSSGGPGSAPAVNDDLRLVFWELTARCNLKCCHCRAEAKDSFAAGELTTDQILSVARAIREAGDPIMVLTGGEPLVRKDFFDIAKACVGMFSRVALATNGTIVDDELARRIVAAGIQRVSVSLDGAKATTHDAFRGVPGSFDATVRGYDAMARAGASLQVNATVARHNIDEVEDLLNFVLARKAAAFHVFALVPVGCGAQISEDARLSSEQMETFLRWLFEKSIALRDRIHIKATCAPQYYRIMREVSREKGLSMPAGHGHGHGAGQGPARGMEAMTRGCLAGSAVCFISRTGDVQPCGYLPVRVGNVLKQPFGEIWRNSDVFKSLRNPSQLKGKCGSCGYRVVCEGCRARAYAATSDFMSEDPDCSYVSKPHER